MEILSKRNIASVLVGPLALIPALVFYGMVANLLGPEDDVAWLQIAELYFLVGVPLAYAATFILGIPVGLVLDYFGKLTAVNLSAVAVVVSAPIMLFSNEQIYAWITTSYLSVSVVLGCWYVRKKVG